MLQNYEEYVKDRFSANPMFFSQTVLLIFTLIPVMSQKEQNVNKISCGLSRSHDQFFNQ